MNELEKLRKNIIKFNKAYEKGTPLVEDYVYDFYKKKLSILEEKQEVKISNIIGPNPNNTTIHLKKILSLEHDFGANSIEKFIKKIEKKTIPFPLIAETKIDGVSLIARYSDGKLITIATRGNGIKGENITHLKNFLNIPEEIFLKPILEIRFEAYLDKKLFKNPRNAAAGILMKKEADPNLKYMKLAPHNLYCNEKIWSNYAQLRELFEKMHLTPIKNHQICNNLNEAYSFFNKINEIKNELDHEIDGVVFKINEEEKQKLLGNTAKAPKFAFAIKFENSFAISCIKQIEYQVGRLGKITPVAIIEEVTIKNRKITKATLNNLNDLKKNNYAIDDVIKIEMAGEVIPKITQIIKKSKNKITIPTKCPICKSELINEICEKNWECPAQKIEKLAYFGNKTGIDIKGLSTNQIKFFVEENILQYPYDFFEIEKNFNQITKKPSWLAMKSLTNLINAIEKAKYSSLQHFYTSLGIPQIGFNKAIELERLFPNFKDFLQCTIEDLTSFGPIVSQAIFKYKEKEKFWIEKTFQKMKINQQYKETLELFD